MKKWSLIGNFTFGLLILLFALAICIFSTPIYQQSNQVQISADSGWFYEDGSPASLSNLQYSANQVILHRTISADELRSSDFCFTATNTNFTIYLNDQKLYDCHMSPHFLYGKPYGTTLHCVAIPHFEGQADLNIHAYDISSGDRWSGFNDCYFEIGSEYLLSAIRKNFLPNFLLIFIFFSGMFFLAIGILIEKQTDRKIELISLGSLSMILSLWIGTDHYFSNLFTNNFGYMRMLNYLTLIVVPIPWITLIAKVTGQLKNKLVKVIIFLSFLNLLSQLILTACNVIDYHQMLPLSHGIFVLGVCISFYWGIHWLRLRHTENTQDIIIFFAYTVLMITGIIDLIQYYTEVSDDVCRFSRFGLYIYTILLTGYEIYQLLFMAQKNRELQLMDRLAHRDGMTDLPNRLSFNEYEARLLERGKGKCIIVQFDINGLKTMNDNHGHLAGDQLIIAGSNAIANSFGQYGYVFRTGGDEFVAILPLNNIKHSPTSIYMICEENLRKWIEAYNEQENPPVPLSIAYGMAVCDFEKDDLTNREILADKKMYVNKRKQKGLD